MKAAVGWRLWATSQGLLPGVLLFVFSGLGAWIGFRNLGNEAVFILFLSLGCLTLICLIQTLLCSFMICQGLRGEPKVTPFAEPIVADQPVSLSRPLHAGWLDFLASVKVTLKPILSDVTSPDAMDEITISNGTTSFPHRLQWSGYARTIGISDHLGLFKLTLNKEFPDCPVNVWPATSSFPKFHLRSLGDSDNGDADEKGKGEGDYLDMRSYQEGDSVRYINWKIYARTGKLMTRIPEHISDKRVSLFFFPSGSDGSGNGDAIAAEFIRYFIEKKPLGRNWILGLPGMKGIFESTKEVGREKILNQVARTGNLEFSDPKVGLDGLKKFLLASRRLGVRKPLIVIGKNVAPDMIRKMKSLPGGREASIVHCRDRRDPKRDRFSGVDEEAIRS